MDAENAIEVDETLVQYIRAHGGDPEQENWLISRRLLAQWMRRAGLSFGHAQPTANGLARTIKRHMKRLPHVYENPDTSMRGLVRCGSLAAEKAVCCSLHTPNG